MDKKDKLLEELFSQFDPAEKPDIKVTEQAKKMLVSRQREKEESLRKRRRFVRFFAAASAALIVLFVAVRLMPGGNHQGEENKTPVSVFASEIIISRAEADDISTQMPFILQAQEVKNLKVYKYSFKNEKGSFSKGDIALYYADFAVAAMDGYAYVRIYAEQENIQYFKLNAFKEISAEKQFNGIRMKKGDAYIEGEYVTKAYFEDNGIKYNIEIQSNMELAAEAVLLKIAESFDA